MKLIFLILGILWLNLNLSIVVTATGGEMFYIQNKTGSDYGSGNYQYPQYRDFEPYQNLLDITELKIEQLAEDYLFNFTFVKITNPWDKDYGFSHPLIEIYIDNQEGGSTTSFQQAARVNFDSRHPWNKLLKISGEFVRVYAHEDGSEELIDLSSMIGQSDWDLSAEDAKIWTEGHTIKLQIRQEILGSLQKASLYVLIGSFNPFGPGYYREIRSEPSSWFFYDLTLTEAEVEYAPRVIDIILPEGKDQKEVLGNFTNGKYAVVYPVKIGEEEHPVAVDWYIYLLVFTLVIIILFYFFIKKNQGKQRD